MSTTPALERGIAILKLMENGTARSLDYITRETGFPKSSVLRILHTLLSLGLVTKTQPDQEWQAQARIEYLNPVENRFSAAVNSTLESLTQELGYTAEWYEGCEEGYRVAKRREAISTVAYVKATIGFIRLWVSELESVLQIGYSHDPKAPAPRASTSFWVYDEAGKERSLKHDEVITLLALSKEQGISRDAFFNSNGVMRVSAPVFCGTSFAGILSIAMNYTPDWRERAKLATRLLEEEREKLEMLFV